VSVRVGDASALHQDQSLQPVAAVMSVFGLQQLQPAPGQVRCSASWNAAACCEHSRIVTQTAEQCW
jgi:hypothetical protein